MSPNSTLGVNLSLDYDSSDYIIIEQEPWPKDVGRTSKSQGILTIGSMVFGGNIPSPNCGGLGGFDAPVYVYPSRVDLHFRFEVSHGDFLPGAARFLVREEVVQCRYGIFTEVQYPVNLMLQLEWIGLCYDLDGNVVGRPEITVVGKRLVFSAKVYGSIRVRYLVYRVEYNVRIEERGDSIENNFSCVAFCVWSGGVQWREIEAPSGYEDTRGNCGNGIYGDSDICLPEFSGSYPKTVRADRLTEVDYCSQEIMSDTVTEAVDRGNDEEPCSD